MRVVIDANLIIERDWYLSGSAVAALLAAAQRGRVHLVVPEVVVREVVTAHAERETAAKTKFDAARAALERLVGPLSDVRVPAYEEPFMRRTYDSWLRERLSESRVEVPSIPEMSEQLVDRALRRRRPFDSNGRAGFRDALIWQTVVDGASDNHVTLLATANTKDFASEDKSALHPHLVEDLAASGLSSAAVGRVGSLEEAAGTALEPARDVLDHLRQRVTAEPEWSDGILELMRQEAAEDMPWIDDTGVSVTVEGDTEPGAGDVINADLEELTISVGPFAADAFPLTDSVYAVVLEASGHAQYQVEVSTTGLWRQPNRARPSLELSPDERTAYLPAFAEVRALFDGRYDLATGELSALSLMGLVDG